METTRLLKRKMGKVAQKLFALLLVPIFILSGIAFAAPTDPGNIVVPAEYGSVKSRFNGKSGRLIINVMDVHCNYEAQTNIAKILEGLIKGYGMNFVALEGADGIVDTSRFQLFKDAEARREAADRFMKEGELSGPEFLSVTAGYPIRLVGVETRSFYLQNRNAFTSSLPFKGEAEKYFNSIRSSLGVLKKYAYSAELKTLDAKVRGYYSKDIPLNDYIRFLQAEARKNGIDMRKHANLFKMFNVLAYEDRVDFTAADKERTALIDELRIKVSNEAAVGLVAQSISFKTGKTSSAACYSHLKDIAANTGIDISKNYPNLHNYIIYNSLYSTIDGDGLFREMKSAEAAIKEKLFESDDQRALDRASRHVDILIGLMKISLLKSDFDYYRTHKDEFASDALAGFIAKMSARYGLPYTPEPHTDAVAKSVSKLEEFYTIAIKRDKAFVENTLRAMKREGQSTAVLVTGGFHSEGIARLLEKEGVSYVVISPLITKDAPTPYIQALTGRKASLEKSAIGAAKE